MPSLQFLTAVHLEIESYYLPKSGLELAPFLPQSARCWVVGEPATPSSIPVFNSNCLYSDIWLGSLKY